MEIAGLRSQFDIVGGQVEIHTLMLEIAQSGPSCSKLMTSLVNETINFQKYCKYNFVAIFGQKNVNSFCTAKAFYNFSANNITAIGYVSNVRVQGPVVQN